MLAFGENASRTRAVYDAPRSTPSLPPRHSRPREETSRKLLSASAVSPLMRYSTVASIARLMFSFGAKAVVLVPFIRLFPVT